MVQLVPVYLCCFGNADREGMLARRDICQRISSGITSEPGHQLERDRSDDPNGSSTFFPNNRLWQYKKTGALSTTRPLPG